MIRSMILLIAFMTKVGCTSPGPDTNETMSENAIQNIQEIEFKDVRWLNNGPLAPGEKLLLAGKLLGASNAELNFSISQTVDTPGPTSEQGLSVKIIDPEPNQDRYDFQVDGEASIVATDRTCNGDYVLRIEANAEGASDTMDLDFTVVNARDCRGNISLQKTGERSGEIYNILGPNPGAYNLLDGRAVKKQEDDGHKDLRDVTYIGSLKPGGGFSRALDSANGARFLVNPSRITSLSTSRSELDEAWNAGNITSTTPPLSQGDIILVKLNSQRDPDGIYVVLVEEVDMEAGASQRKTNGGMLRFSFTKF